MEKNENSSKILRWSVIIGIVVVLNLFFNYALSLAISTPIYDNFCPSAEVVTPPTSQSSCLSVGGQWTETAQPAYPVSIGKMAPIVSGYCNTTYSCQKKYDAATDAYQKNIFISLVVLGILTLIVALFLKSSEVVSIALSLGGVLSLVIASIRYWSAAQSYIHVAILAVALVALLWVAIKKFSR